MRRVRTIALWVVGVAAVLLVVAWFGLKAYVGSSSARRLAATQISEAIGLPVEIDELSVGATSTSAVARIPDGDTGDDLIRIGSLNTDITFAGLLTGRVAPTTVTLGDVDILFRIDADGTVLSPLPKLKEAGSASGKPIPAVSITSGRVRIRQTGKPEFALTGVTGELRRDGEGYTISGTVNDSNWGGWRIAGRLTNDPADGSVELSTEQGPLKDPLLRSIPYVPPELWDHLKATGETPAKVSFTFKPGTDLGYAVELRPKANATLTVPDADVTVSQVQGLIRIADGKVTVADGRVAIAEGTMGVTGEYDFSRPNAVLTAKLSAVGMDIRKLPADWGLPKEFEGKLRGVATLTVTIHEDGKVDPQGEGSGEIVGAKVAGLDAEVKLKLTSRGGRYRFDAP